MAADRGSWDASVTTLEDAKESLEFSSLGQNELYKQSEAEKQYPITRTLYDEHGDIVERMVVSPRTWRELRRNGKL